MPDVKFGWEAEFEEGADGITTLLHSLHPRTMGCRELHSYHCNCSVCTTMDLDVEYVYPLRAQTDSSCSGEIISKPFIDMNEARLVMQTIEDTAAFVDAVPGWSAGFHVHVDRPENPFPSFLEFLRYEEVLVYIARGRFPTIRSMNRWVRNDLIDYLQNVIRNTRELSRKEQTNRTAIAESAFELIREMPTPNQEMWVGDLYARHRESDRHSNLNLRTRNSTWEFRLFNSTRSAWRMELFCSIALGFCDPVFVDHLASSKVQTESIHQAFLAAGNNRAADLLTKQLNYIGSIDNGTTPYSEEFATL